MGNPFEDGQRAYEDDLLDTHCRPVGLLWAFDGEAFCYERAEALGIIRAFTGLGLGPTSLHSPLALVALYDRVDALEKDLRHSQLKP
jgi:hypothetical protein